jgi:hypothetical protein
MTLRQLDERKKENSQGIKTQNDIELKAQFITPDKTITLPHPFFSFHVERIEPPNIQLLEGKKKKKKRKQNEYAFF